MDVLAVNKADGDNARRAEDAARQLREALHYTPPRDAEWQVPVEVCSSVTGVGVERVWGRIEGRYRQLERSGRLAKRRRAQSLGWMWGLIDEELRGAFRTHPEVAGQLAAVEEAVREGELAASDAALQLLAAFGIRSGR